MNIHARITPRFDPDATAEAAVGLAYEAYWSRWVQNLVKQAQSQTATAMTALPAGTRAGLQQLAKNHGTALIFQASLDCSTQQQFEPTAYALRSAQSPQQLIQRWHQLLTAQAVSRFGGRLPLSLPDFIQINGTRSMLFRPHLSPMANRDLHGPACLAGATLSLLKRLNLPELQAWQLPIAGAAKRVYANGRATGIDIDYDSDWLIGWAQQRQPAAVTPVIAGDLQFLGNGQHQLWLQQLLQHLPTGKGRHADAPELARIMHMSPRSFSRRLQEAGLSYTLLSRFARLRAASADLQAGLLDIDEIAYRSDYADRQHLSREFRSMSGMTVGQYREIMNS